MLVVVWSCQSQWDVGAQVEVTAYFWWVSVVIHSFIHLLQLDKRRGGGGGGGSSQGNEKQPHTLTLTPMGNLEWMIY